jgi:hypothetical protein
MSARRHSTERTSFVIPRAVHEELHLAPCRHADILD